jgi:hydroxymethylpyrimidine/phosphomethylpyrimidine kinase
MVAKSGAPLISDDAIDTLKTRLLPLATLLTPNRFEAARLARIPPVEDEPTARDAARRLLDLGPRAVVVKGIRESGRVVDLLVTPDGTERLESPMLSDGQNHGSGCTFSAAVTARLALGDTLTAAVSFAHAAVHRAIASSPRLGRGVHAVNVLAI